jgi:hypothetical protein
VKLDSIIDKALSRRTFLAGAGSVAATTLIVGCGNDGTMPPNSTGVTDADILNFALNLEYLEAEFYLHAATGSGLASADAGSSPGAVTGGAMVAGLSTAQQNILNEIAYDEQEHVRFLRSALASSAVARPAIDLTNSFNALANAAGIASTFNPFADFNSFLVGAFIFEDVGVTAYNGAATLISDAGIKAGYLAAAAGIMAVEAYHAAYVRATLTANATTQGTSAYPYFGYANKVSALRASVGGGDETMLTVPTGTTTSSTTVTPTAVVAADNNALAYARTTDQVLHIVYGAGGAAGVKSGAFFPNGLNGKIAVTQS